MKKKSFSAIIAVSAFLFIAGYLLGCSDDKDSGGYLSCSEATKVIRLCDDKSLNGEIGSSCPDNDDDCGDRAYQKCLVDEGLCGNNNINACFAHYKAECPDDDD